MNTKEIVISSKDAVLLNTLVHRADHLPGHRPRTAEAPW